MDSAPYAFMALTVLGQSPDAGRVLEPEQLPAEG
jgi:hypothetical protein